jgi:hypothetical protein
MFAKCPYGCRSHSSLRCVYSAWKFVASGLYRLLHSVTCAVSTSHNIRIRYTRMGGLCSSSLILTAEELYLPVGVYLSHLQTWILIALREGSALTANLRDHLGRPVLFYGWGRGRFFQFLNLYTVGRTPWTGDQPVARRLPTRRISAHRHPCLEWDSDPRSQCLNGQRQFML